MAFTAALADIQGASDISRVLIVDDSVVARTALGRIVDATSRFVVVGAVGDARSALDFLSRHEVEIVLLDLEMPGVDGLTALPDLIAAGRGARVLVVSGATGKGATATVQALALGAADTLEKPSGGGFATKFAAILEDKLARLVDHAAEAVRVATVRRPPTRQPGLTPFDIVAIGASTGGIHALTKLLRALPQGFNLPILITQHLPANFMPYFAAQLSVLSGRPCDVAEQHMRVRPGRIMIAPGDGHINLVSIGSGVAVRLTRDAYPSGCTPSVDPMFETAANVYGSRALGVVLSGMGRDGAQGARALLDAGAQVVVQDRGSSVVWGMPGAVARDGNATAVLPPEDIGELIARSVGR